MAAPRSSIEKWGQYLAARLMDMSLTTLPVDLALKWGAWTGQAFCWKDKRRRNRIEQHLRLAFPQWTDPQIRAMAGEAYEHFIQLVVEICHTPRLLHPDNWAARVTLSEMSEGIALLNGGKPALLVTGHVGNWEVLGTLLAVLGYPIDAIARPIDNPLVNDWLIGIRERRGLRIITKFNASDRMIEVLQRGGALGFIADQNAGDKGLFVPFFGKLASTYKSIGLLAVSQNVPVICGYARRYGPSYHYQMGIVDIIHPQDWEHQEDRLFYVTARFMRAIETMVRACPGQYLWMHRRWKSRPPHERHGKPMPASLQRKLESLPWMDQPTLQRLQEPMSMSAVT